MRLLRVALDLYPDTKALDVVLDLLKQYIDVGRKRKGPRRAAWYCAAELLRAGATETGLVADSECLPENINLALYQEKLAGFAEQIAARRNTHPWYLEQQAHLFLACVGRDVNRRIAAGTSPYLKDYLRLHHTLSSRISNLRREDIAPFVLIQSQFQGVRPAARTFLLCFREAASNT